MTNLCLYNMVEAYNIEVTTWVYHYKKLHIGILQHLEKYQEFDKSTRKCQNLRVTYFYA